MRRESADTFTCDPLTEKPYLNDAYLREVDAVVIAVNGNQVVLDRTVFYPGGGGQPCDTGTIVHESHSYRVTDAKKDGDSVIHVLDQNPDLKPGQIVHCVIDWERRYAIMRYHTAIHVIDAVMETTGRYSSSLTGGMIYPDKLHFDINMAGITRELAMQILDEAQQQIDKGLRIIVRTLPQNEALKIPNLSRTAPGRELLQKLSTVRIVEIETLDFQMDGGTHVANTKEIGKIMLSKFENKGSNRKRIELKLV